MIEWINVYDPTNVSSHISLDEIHLMRSVGTKSTLAQSECVQSKRNTAAKTWLQIHLTSRGHLVWL